MSEQETPYLDGGVGGLGDLGEPWRLSGPDGRTVLNKRGQVVAEIRHCPPEVRGRIVECVNAGAGVPGPEAFLFDALAALRPFAELWQRNPALHEALNANPRAKETIVGVPLAFLERALAVVVAGGKGRVGITEQVSQALWKALITLGEPGPPEVAMVQTAGVLKLGLERISGLEGGQQ